MNSKSGQLKGIEILVAEDEFLIADDLVNILELHGAIVIGPVPSVEQGLEIANSIEHLDGAVLDINLQGDAVYPLADILRQRNIPFIFTTGYDVSALPPRYAQVPRCEKPVNAELLIETIARAIPPRKC